MELKYKIEQDYTDEELKNAISTRERNIKENTQRLRELKSELNNRLEKLLEY